MVMGRFGVIQKWCSILVWTDEILAGGRGVPQFYIQKHAVQTRYAALCFSRSAAKNKLKRWDQ